MITALCFEKLKKCTSMLHDCIDFRYTYVTDTKNGNTYHNINSDT